MSVLQQVLSDARKLATRLRDHDSSADNLLTQAQSMFKQVESMKDYCEEMNQLNEVANNRPRGALIHSIRQENRYIRELQEENKELREALEEQQNVMELIMSKYREQVAKLLTSGPDLHAADNTAMQRKLGANIERVGEMVMVMRRAAQLDEQQSNHYQQLLSGLARENKGLREMLQIAMKAGSLANPQLFDVDTQTDCCITGMDSPPNFSPNTDTIKLNPHFSPHSSSSSSESPSHASASSEALSSGTCCEVSPTQESIVEDTESVEEDAS